MDAADDGAAEAGGEDVLLNPHQYLRLGPGLLGLGHVHVHLVAVEVGVVGRADGGIEPEGLVRHDLDPVGHDGHSVQGRLAVE